MSRVTWTAAALFVGTVTARLLFYLLTAYTADDAYITFRYAENLAYGLGFVYNEGERVLGTSTPLFTFLLAITRLLHMPMVVGALILSLLASGLTTVVIYRYARTLRFTAFAVLPAVAYMLWPRSLPADISGMETAVFTFLVTAAFYYQHKRFEVYALGMATLAALTRPEGLGVLVILLVYNLYRNFRAAPIYLVTPAIMLLPWLIFAWLYFGSPIPHSMTAKLALYSQFGAMSPADALVYLLGLHNPFGWLSVIAVILGARWIYVKQFAGRLELLWVLLMIFFFAFSRTHLFHWYVAPIYPLYLLFATAAILLITNRFNFTPVQVRRIAAGTAVVLAAVLAAGNYPQVAHFKQLQETLASVHQAVGYYLFEKTPPTALIAAEDIGYAGYYSRRRILDRDGLVSPRAVPYNKEARYLDMVLTTQPDYVVAAADSPISQFVDSSAFTSRFVLEKTFSHATTEYRIYARR